MGDNASAQGSDDGRASSPMPKIRWTRQVEKLLTDFADTAACYKWLNDQSYRKYKMINYFYNIPIIIMSTLSGAVSVGMSGFVPQEYMGLAQLAVGAVNIINGIISTLLNFFRYAQLSESHNNAYVGWSRLHRNIKIELSVERKNRKNPNDFIKVCRSEYDRLMEQQPIIPKDVLRKFRERFKDSDIVTPDEAKDTLKKTVIYEDNDDDYDSDTNKEKEEEKPKKNPKENWKVVRNHMKADSIVNSLKKAAVEGHEKRDHQRKVDESRKRVEDHTPQPSIQKATEVTVNIDKIREEAAQNMRNVMGAAAGVAGVVAPTVAVVAPTVRGIPARSVPIPVKYAPPPKEEVVNLIKAGGSSVKSLLSKFGGGSISEKIVQKVENVAIDAVKNGAAGAVARARDDVIQAVQGKINEVSDESRKYLNDNVAEVGKSIATGGEIGSSVLSYMRNEIQQNSGGILEQVKTGNRLLSDLEASSEVIRNRSGSEIGSAVLSYIGNEIQGRELGIPVEQTKNLISQHLNDNVAEVGKSIATGGEIGSAVLSYIGNEIQGQISEEVEEISQEISEAKKDMVKEYVDSTVNNISDLREAVTSEFMQELARRQHQEEDNNLEKSAEQ